MRNRALNGLEIERRSITPNYESHTLIIREFAVSDLHFATVYGLRTNLGGCKIPKFSRGGCPQIPALRVEVRTNVVCPCCALATAMSWLRHTMPFHLIVALTHAPVANLHIMNTKLESCDNIDASYIHEWKKHYSLALFVHSDSLALFVHCCVSINKTISCHLTLFVTVKQPRTCSKRWCNYNAQNYRILHLSNSPCARLLMQQSLTS